MSETTPPYLKAEEQSPINKASAMIEDYLIGIKKEFGDLHRAISDIEAWNQDLRRENGELLDKLHDYEALTVSKRPQPCGCILCRCELNEENRCSGCGAKMCPENNCPVRRGIIEYESHPMLDTINRLKAEIKELRATAELIGFIKPAIENIASTKNFRDPADHANSAIATAQVILQKIAYLKGGPH